MKRLYITLAIIAGLSIISLIWSAEP